VWDIVDCVRQCGILLTYRRWGRLLTMLDSVGDCWLC